MSLQNVVDQEESESSVQTEGAESADLTECKETRTPHVLTGRQVFCFLRPARDSIFTTCNITKASVVFTVLSRRHRL